jgi:biotin carboxylase
MSDLPRLIISHGHRSVPPLALHAAASGICDLIWFIDSTGPEMGTEPRLLRKIGVVVDRAGLSFEQSVAALAEHAPSAITTFRDDDIVITSLVAAQLGLKYHDPMIALRLTDKESQRDALRAAGLPTPGTWSLPASGDADFDRVTDEIGYPAVVKPRAGNGSWHTFLVQDKKSLLDVLDDLARDDLRDADMIVEEYLPSKAEAPDELFADYVSTETFVVDGQPHHVAITGRLPLAFPFRETGFFVPSQLSDDDAAAVLEASSAVIAAIGVKSGPLHVEIKLTPAGPRLIEVNGRLGGGIPNIVKLAGGPDLLVLAIRDALAHPMVIDSTMAFDRVGYRFFYQPPAAARTVEAVEGIRDVTAMPGVESVNLLHGPGTSIDAREGSRSMVFSVIGHTADHASMLAARRRIDELVKITYSEARVSVAQ